MVALEAAIKLNAAQAAGNPPAQARETEPHQAEQRKLNQIDNFHECNGRWLLIALQEPAYMSLVALTVVVTWITFRSV